MVPSARRPLRVRRWDGYALVSENRQNTSRLLTPGAQYRRRCHLLGPWTARRFRQTPLRTQHAYFGPSAEYIEGGDSKDYTQALTDSFVDQLKERGHELDYENTRIEAWGESFEGCAYGYSTTLTRQLGLKQPVYVNFDMCVPDTRLLCKADLITHFLLPGTPVRGYVFDGPGGFPMGVFYEGFARQDAGRTGRIQLRIDNSKVTIEAGIGITLYANLCAERPDGRRIPKGPQRSDDEIIVTDDGLELPRGKILWIMASHLSQEKLIQAMRSAKVTEN